MSSTELEIDGRSGKLRIGTAVEADIKKLVEISRLTIGNAGFWTSQVFGYYMNGNTPSAVLVATWRDEIVGYVAYRYEQPTIALHQLAVLPEFRRNGIMSKLIYKIAKGIDIRRYSTIVGTVDEYNLPAQMLLQSLGFSATTVMKGRKRDEHDTYTYEFFLPQYVAGAR